MLELDEIISLIFLHSLLGMNMPRLHRESNTAAEIFFVGLLIDYCVLGTRHTVLNKNNIVSTLTERPSANQDTCASQWEITV